MATDAITPPPAPPAAPALSEPSRILNMFFAPSKTFVDLKRSAAWWGPLVLTIVIAMLYAYSVDSKITIRKVMENQIALSPKAQERMEKIPADQREGAMAMQEKITRGISYGFWIFLLLGTAISSAVLLAYFKVAANADLTYGKMFAISMYAGVPGALKFLLAFVMLMAGLVPADTFNMNNPIATNLASFMDPAGNKALYTLGSAVDVFAIWSLVLTAIGVVCVSKVKSSQAYIGVFGWYAVVILFFAGIAAISG